MGSKRSLVLLMLLIGAVPGYAGPLEDGNAAYNREDYATAAKFFAQGAAQGDPQSQGLLGVMYTYGMGVQQDVAQGIQWLKLSAKNGNAASLDVLGDIYSKGFVAKPDWPLAQSYYLESAKAGNASAQNSIGYMYLLGQGNVAQDYKKAIPWFELAAKNDNAEAQFNLGSMNYYGWGMEQNYAQSMYWWTLAAKQGHVAAETFLGVSYDNGHGVPQDYAEAIRHYSTAARHGNLTALAVLGEKYFNGQGVTRDYLKAYILLNLSASQISKDMQKSISDERDQAARQLTPSQLASAQEMASRCNKEISTCEVIPGDGGVPSPGAPRSLTSATGPRAPGELFGTGSGFYINGNGDVVTNAHVVQECSAVRIGGASLKPVAIDTDSDLALLRSNRRTSYFAKLRGGKGARLGEGVLATGYPLPGVLSDGAIVSSGNISALAGLGNDRRNIQISAPVQPGNSGGPLIGDDGAILGVVSGKLDAIKVAGAINDIPQNVNFAVSLGTLQSFLNANNVTYAVALPTGAKSSAVLSSEASRYTVQLQCWK